MLGMIYTGEPGQPTTALPFRGPRDLPASVVLTLNRQIQVIICEVLTRVSYNLITMFTCVKGHIPRNLSSTIRGGSRPQDTTLAGRLQNMYTIGPTTFAIKREQPGDDLSLPIQVTINAFVSDHT